MAQPFSLDAEGGTFSVRPGRLASAFDDGIREIVAGTLQVQQRRTQIVQQVVPLGFHQSSPAEPFTGKP